MAVDPGPEETNLGIEGAEAAGAPGPGLGAAGAGAGALGVGNGLGVAPLVAQPPNVAAPHAKRTAHSRFMGTFGLSAACPNRASPLTPPIPSGKMTQDYGANAPPQRDVRASEGRPLAESHHALVPGEGRSHLRVRP